MSAIFITRSESLVLLLLACLLCLPQGFVEASAQETIPGLGPLQDDEPARLRDAVERNPRPGTAFDFWVRSLLEQGSLEEAVLAQRTRAESTDEVSDDLVLALLLQRAGDDQQAGVVLASAANAPDSSLAAQLYGDWLGRERRLEEAIAAYRIALSRRATAHDRLTLHLGLGRWCLRLGRRQEALAAWEALVAERPRDRLLLEELADVLADEGLRDDARRRWEQARRLAPLDPTVQYRCTMAIARLHTLDGDSAAARKALTPLLDVLDGESWQAREVREQLVASYLARGDIDALVALFEQRFQRQPDDLAARVALADALIRTGRLSQASHVLNGAIARAPGRDDLREQLVRTLMRSKEWTDAEAACREWVSARPQAAQPRWMLGHLFIQQAGRHLDERDLPRILDAWSSIAAVDDRDASLALRVATLCDELAIQHSRRHPDTGRRTLDRTGWLRPVIDMAERHYRLALERDGEFIEAQESFGLFLAASGRREEALAQWAAMVAPPRNTPERLVAVAETLLQAGERDEALRVLQRAIAKVEQPRPLIARAIHLTMQGEDAAFDADLGRLLNAYEASAENDNDLRVSFELRAELAARAKHGPALAMAQRAFDTSSTANHAWRLGLLQSAFGRRAEAVTSLRTAYLSEPGRPHLHLALAEALEANRETPAALYEYQALADAHPRFEPTCLERIATIQLGRACLPQAMAAATQLMSLAPGRSEYARLAARIARRMGDDQRAVLILHKALRSAPRDATLRTSLADLLHELELSRAALEQFWLAFLDETSTSNRMDLAQRIGALAIQEGRVEPFAQRFRDQLDAKPQDETLNVCFAEFLVAGDESGDAISHLEALHAAHPDDLFILERLVARSDEFGSVQATIRHASRLVDLDPAPSHLEMLAQRLTRVGRHDEARATWMRSLEADASSVHAVLETIEGLIEQGETRHAFTLADTAATSLATPNALTLWAALLAMDLRDTEAMERHFGALALEPVTTDDTSLQPVIERLLRQDTRAPTFTPLETSAASRDVSWTPSLHFDDRRLLDPTRQLLRTLPRNALHRLAQRTRGALALHVVRSNGQLDVQSQEGSKRRRFYQADSEESGPSFSMVVHVDMLREAAEDAPRELTVDPFLHHSQNLLSQGSSGTFMSKEASSRPPAAAIEATELGIHGAIVPSGGDLGAVAWPDDGSFRLFQRAWQVENDGFSHASAPPVDIPLLSSLFLTAEEQSLFSLNVLLQLADQRRASDAWLGLQEHHPRPEVRDQLLAVLASRGRFRDAFEWLNDTSPADTLLRPLTCLALSDAVRRGETSDDLVRRSIEQVGTWNDTEHRFHAQLSLLSHLVVLGRSVEAGTWFQREILPTADVEELIECTPWVARLEDEALVQQALAPLFAAADSAADPELRDEALLGLARAGSTQNGREIADRVIQRVRQDVQRGVRDPHSWISLRLGPSQIRTMRYAMPAPVGHLTPRTLALLETLHAQLTSAGTTDTLHQSLDVAREQATDTERLTLEALHVTLLWLDGRRLDALAALAPLQATWPLQPDVALLSARASHAHGDAAGTQAALDSIWKSLEAMDPSDAWVAAIRFEAEALRDHAFTRDLLGSPDDVLEGLFTRLDRYDDTVDLSVYLADAAAREPSVTARHFIQDGFPAPSAWHSKPTTWLSATELIEHARTSGALAELSEALERFRTAVPSHDDALALSLLATEAARDAEALHSLCVELAEAGADLRPLHPECEPALLRCVRDARLRGPAMRGLARVVVGSLERAELNQAANTLRAMLEPRLKTDRIADDAWRADWRSAFASPTPNPRVSELLHHVFEMLAPTKRSRVASALFDAAASHVRLQDPGDALRLLTPRLVRARLGTCNAPTCRAVSDSLEFLLTIALERTSRPATPKETQGVLRCPLVGLMVESAMEGGVLTDHRERLEQRSDAHRPTMLAARFLAAEMAGDQRAADSRLLALRRQGWTSVDFGQRNVGPADFELATQRVHQHLQESEFDSVESAVELCQALARHGEIEGARSVAQACQQAQPQSSLHAGWKVLLPASGQPHHTMLDILNSFAPDPVHPEHCAFRGMVCLWQGESDRAGRELESALRLHPTSDPTTHALHAWWRLRTAPPIASPQVPTVPDERYRLIELPAAEAVLRHRIRIFLGLET